MAEEVKVTPKTETPSLEKSIEEGLKVGSNIPPQQHISPLASFLNVDTQDPKTTEKLNYIYTELRQDTKEFNEGDMLHKLRSLEQRMGMPALGESRIGKIYNYLRASEQVRKAEKLRDAYLR